MPSLLGHGELRNSERELQQFQFRLGVAGATMLAAFAILLARFVFLQVVQHDHYRSKAEDNRISIVPITSGRCSTSRIASAAFALCVALLLKFSML